MSTDLCSVVGGNTGGVNCDTKRKRPVKIVVGGKQFSASDYADAATLMAAIIAACKLPAGSASKLFPLPEIFEVAVNTPASTSGNLTHGPVRRLVKGKPAYTYTVEIGVEQYKKLLAFDGKLVPAFTFDDSNNYWGYRAIAAANTANTNVFKGEMVYITIEGNGFEDGSAAATGQCTISVSYQSVDDFEKRGTYMNLPDLASGDLVGLKDVTLVEPAAHVSNVHSLVPYIQTQKLAGDLDIGSEFGTIIAAATWTAFTGATYATSLTITSVAYTAGKIVVTFDSTAYTALTNGDKIKLVPPAASVLDAAGATGIEIGYIILTK